MAQAVTMHRAVPGLIVPGGKRVVRSNTWLGPDISSGAGPKNVRPAEKSRKGNVMEGSWNYPDLETGLLVGGTTIRSWLSRSGEAETRDLKEVGAKEEWGPPQSTAERFRGLLCKTRHHQ